MGQSGRAFRCFPDHPVTLPEWNRGHMVAPKNNPRGGKPGGCSERRDVVSSQPDREKVHTHILTPIVGVSSPLPLITVIAQNLKILGVQPQMPENP